MAASYNSLINRYLQIQAQVGRVFAVLISKKSRKFEVLIKLRFLASLLQQFLATKA